VSRLPALPAGFAAPVPPTKTHTLPSGVAWIHKIKHDGFSPTLAQQAALDELKDASVKAAGGLKINCPTYQTLIPTGRVEAMEKRLEATLAAVKTCSPRSRNSTIR
jgi:hypothetical protein